MLGSLPDEGVQREDMQVDRERIAKLINGQMSAMFATWREAAIPEQALDAIVQHDKIALEMMLGYLREADMSDSERTLRANIISWTVNTIGLALELGMILEKNDTDRGQLPAFKKDV